MKRIEMDRWEPVPGEPHKVRRVGQRTAQEVFEELYHRLDSTGYLPDEYFLMDRDWQDGREIPKDAGLFCTTDFGGSEGIYLDIYLKWYDDEQKKHITQNFATGKTLGETGADMDRMHLISSAVIKAFHSDGEHARYIRLGEPEKAEGAVLHLNGKEQRLLIDSLVDRRRHLRDETIEVEQLLRRVTGSVIEFVNEVGARPMRISEYDRAVLAIQDGAPDILAEVQYNVPDRIGELLPLAAGRPGNVGFKMTATLLVNAKDIPQEQYLIACKNAVATGDKDRVLMLGLSAEECVKDLDMSLYGEVIAKAFDGHRKIAEALLKQCTDEQLRASNPYLLAVALDRGSLSMGQRLVRSGLDINPNAVDVIRSLVWHTNNRYYFKHLLDAGMQIDNGNYPAMHACLDTDNPEAAKLLIDRGMDFDGYSEWAEGQLDGINDEVFETVQGYWEDHKQKQELAGQEQETEPEQGQEPIMGTV